MPGSVSIKSTDHSFAVGNCFPELSAIVLGTLLAQSETLHKRIQRMFPHDSKMLLYFLADYHKMIPQDHLGLKSCKNKELCQYSWCTYHIHSVVLSDKIKG